MVDWEGLKSKLPELKMLSEKFHSADCPVGIEAASYSYLACLDDTVNPATLEAILAEHERDQRVIAEKDAEIAGLRAACEAYEEVNALLLKTWSDTKIDCLGSDAIEHAIITTLKNLGMAEVYAKNRQK